jgi:hypothetical protein
LKLFAKFGQSTLGFSEKASFEANSKGGLMATCKTPSALPCKQCKSKLGIVGLAALKT